MRCRFCVLVCFFFHLSQELFFLLVMVPKTLVKLPGTFLDITSALKWEGGKLGIGKLLNKCEAEAQGS